MTAKEEAGVMGMLGVKVGGSGNEQGDEAVLQGGRQVCSLTSSSAVAHALPLTQAASSLARCVCHFDSFIHSDNLR